MTHSVRIGVSRARMGNGAGLWSSCLAGFRLYLCLVSFLEVGRDRNQT